MSNFMVFMRLELWVNVPVAIFLGTVDFIQVTLFCPSEPRVGAFVYKNAGKVYEGKNMR